MKTEEVQLYSLLLAGYPESTCGVSLAVSDVIAAEVIIEALIQRPDHTPTLQMASEWLRYARSRRQAVTRG